MKADGTFIQEMKNLTRKKIEVKCPYCDGVYAASGMTAHVRHKHPDKYEEFKANRAAIIEKNTIVEGELSPPASAPEEKTTIEPPEPANPAPTEPVERKDEPAPKEQKPASFLGSVGKALRDW